jgi:adenosylcobinamide-GDP ribazoletransferase
MKDIPAAFIFFTRLPVWRLCRVPADSFKRVIAYWPLAGWLTGGLMAGVYGLAGLVFPPATSVLLAFGSRALLTGALHEDGLADFFDGMGGGRTRERVLAIMKDSSIGTYGVLGLMIYVALWAASVVSFAGSPVAICLVLLAGDAWSKWSASQIINLLPYARKAEESKSKTVYERMSPGAFFTGLLAGLLPMACVAVFGEISDLPWRIWLAGIAPPATAGLLALYMKRRIGGYTGDCCGAAFLLCELSFWLTLSGIWKFF